MCEHSSKWAGLNWNLWALTWVSRIELEFVSTNLSKPDLRICKHTSDCAELNKKLLAHTWDGRIELEFVSDYLSEPDLTGICERSPEWAGLNWNLLAYCTPEWAGFNWNLWALTLSELDLTWICERSPEWVRLSWNLWAHTWVSRIELEFVSTLR